MEKVNIRNFLSNSQRQSDTPWAVILAVCAAGPLLAYSLPEQPLTDWPWAAAFANFMAHLIPAIDRLAEISKMPQVTRFFMALQWAIWGPICFMIIAKHNRLSEKSVATWMQVAQTRWWYTLLLPPVGVVFLWTALTLWVLQGGPSTPPGPFDHAIDWMNQSRFWLGLFGSIFVFFTALIAFGLLKSFTIIRMAYAVRSSSPLYRKDKK